MSRDSKAKSVDLSSSSISSSPGALHFGLSSMPALSSSRCTCNFTIKVLLSIGVKHDENCSCGVSVGQHAMSDEQLLLWSTPAVSSSPSHSSPHYSSHSSSLELKKIVSETLPLWNKPYKTCTPFFRALEQHYAIHNIQDESMFKRYLYLTLSALSDSEREFAFIHLINTSLSWNEVKESFAERYERHDHTEQMQKQYNDITYSSSDTIQTFSHKFINIIF